MKVAACMRASSFAISFSRSVSMIVSSCASAVPMPLNACILRERHVTRCSNHSHVWASAVLVPLSACILRERHITRCSNHSHLDAQCRFWPVGQLRRTQQP